MDGKQTLLLLMENSRFCAVSINGSKSDLGYAVAHVCCEDNERCHLKTCQVANGKGKPSNILIFFKSKIESLKMFSGFVFLQPAAFRAYTTRGGENWGLGVLPRILVGLRRELS